MVIYIAAMLAAVSLVSTQLINIQQQKLEDEFAANAAKHLSQYTQAAASRMFEMGSRFILAPGYTTGSPPAGGALWLKNPASCSLSGIPALPLTESSSAVSLSFVPCDFSDQNIYGHNYTTTWTISYPGTVMTIQIGSVPFTVDGARRDDIGGSIALMAQSDSTGGFGDSTLDVMLRYDFNPATGSLTAVIDRTAPFAADAHLRIDGSNMMDATAPIRWGNGMSITPNGTAMEVSAAGGISVKNDAEFDGDIDVLNGDVRVQAGDVTLSNGTLTAVEGIITGVQISGAFDAPLSRAVFDQRINQSGDLVEKPSCPAGSTPQIFVAAASVPTGSGMLINTTSGSISGDVKRFRTSAENAGNNWRVWAEVFVVPGGWMRLSAGEGDLRSSIKCT